MKIGFYKLGKEIYFGDRKRDTASWSQEVVNLAKLYADKNNDVHILSKSDYDDNIKNINKGDINSFHDRIFIYNGPLQQEENINIIEKLKQNTNRLDLCITDTRLLIGLDFSLFDNIYTQSKNLYIYGGLETLAIYNHDFVDEEKSIDFIYGGDERDRSKDFFEYIYRPDILWYGKSETLNIKNKIPHDKYLKLLSQSKYSIIIGDEYYNQNGFVTPRCYENIINNVLSFIDIKFDKDYLIFEPAEFMKVASYREMMTKKKIIDNDKNLYTQLLSKQRQKIKLEYINGDFVYNLLQ